MESRTDNSSGTQQKQLWWLAGAIGTTVGVAALAYKRREPTYWDRARRAAGQVVEAGSEINPWAGIGGASALGCAALAYRLRKPKSRWSKAREQGVELAARTGEQLKPWWGLASGAAIGAASMVYNARSRKRTGNPAAERAASAAYGVVDAGSRFFKLVQQKADTGKLRPQIRKWVG